MFSIRQNGRHCSDGKLLELSLFCALCSLCLTRLCRIGEDAMIHILTETSIFIPLPNGSLCQITGEPLIHMLPKDQVIGLTKPLQVHQIPPPSSPVEKRSWTKIENPEQQPRIKRRKLSESSKSTNANTKTRL